MFPCRGMSASQQMSDLIHDLTSSGLWGHNNKYQQYAHKNNKKLPTWRARANYSYIWLDIEVMCN